MNITNVLAVVLTSLTLVLSSITDIKTKKIPNYIVFPSIVAGLIFTLIMVSPIQMGERFFGLFLWFIVGMLHLLGMGDIKLLMALCAWQGFQTSALCTAIAAALTLLVNLIKNKNRTIQKVKDGLIAIKTGTVQSLYKKKDGIPFAPYLLAGFAIFYIGRLIFI